MRTYLTLVASTVIAPILAQPTFTQANLAPEMGPAPTYLLVDHVPPGPASANFTFNTGPLVLGAGSQLMYMAPGGTPYAASFPQATHASAEVGNPVYIFYQQIDATGIEFLGVAGPDYENNYTDPDRNLALPLSMNDTWTDPWAATVNASGSTLILAGTTTGSYNGYGTLILPWGSYTVGRVEINVTSTSEILGMTTTSESTTVNYFSPGYKGPLFSTTTTVTTPPGQAPVTSTSAQVMDPSLVGIDEFAQQGPSFTLFPNPAEGSTTLRLGADLVGHIHIALFDMLGRTASQHNAVGTGSPQDLELELAGLSTGLYQVLLTDADGRTATRTLVLH